MEISEQIQVAVQAISDENLDQMMISFRNLSLHVNECSYLSNDELFSKLGKSLYRELRTEIYIPEFARVGSR